jgi:hypothetical protein
MGEKRNVYRILVGKPEGKSPLGRPRRNCVDNNKMYLIDIEWVGVRWIGLAYDRNNGKVPVSVIVKFLGP